MTLDQLPPVLGGEDLARAIDFAQRLHVAAPLHDYLVRVVAATRDHPELRLGASPRPGSRCCARRGCGLRRPVAPTSSPRT